MGQAIRFYTDENVAKAVIKGLRQRGVDVLTTPEAGMLEATDPEHLDRARTEGRVLFTHDPDYLALQGSGVEHAGICFAPQDMPIGECIRGLMLVYQVLDMDYMKNHVEFL